MPELKPRAIIEHMSNAFVNSDVTVQCGNDLRLATLGFGHSVIDQPESRKSNQRVFVCATTRASSGWKAVGQAGPSP